MGNLSNDCWALHSGCGELALVSLLGITYIPEALPFHHQDQAQRIQ